jgi:hypothetical protein
VIKLERANPGASKDRIALAMIEDAKERATKKVEPSLKLLQGIQELDSMGGSKRIYLTSYARIDVY